MIYFQLNKKYENTSKLIGLISIALIIKRGYIDKFIYFYVIIMYYI